LEGVRKAIEEGRKTEREREIDNGEREPEKHPSCAS
jgi:hypothetical protein